MKIRDYLFKDFHGCANGDCIVKDKRGQVVTNGCCNCLANMSRGQLDLISSRIRRINDKEVQVDF